MAHKKKGGQSGKKGGSLIEQSLDRPVTKNKAKKEKKQSRGKNK